jgi:hypothetical protein
LVWNGEDLILWLQEAEMFGKIRSVIIILVELIFPNGFFWSSVFLKKIFRLPSVCLLLLALRNFLMEEPFQQLVSHKSSGVRHAHGWKMAFIFCWDKDLNSGLHAYKAGTLLLESHLKSILLCFFWR